MELGISQWLRRTFRHGFAAFRSGIEFPPQERILRRVLSFTRIHRDRFPAEALHVMRKSEAVEEVPGADNGVYQRLGMPRGFGLTGTSFVSFSSSSEPIGSSLR